MSQTVPDWRAEISCRTHEVGGSFSIFVFLGNVPADPTTWLTDPATAGTFDVFAPSSSPYGPAGDSVTKGFVHLNRAILRISGLPSLGEEGVVRFLRQNINWGIQRVDGAILRLDSVPSLQITIQCTPIIKPIIGHEYEGEPEYFHDITRGRRGGYHGR